mgnify:CR=1 FL=1
MAMKVAELKEELEERGEAKSAVWQQGLAEAAAARSDCARASGGEFDERGSPRVSMSHHEQETMRLFYHLRS